MKDPARTWNGTVVLRIMEKQRTAGRLALCEQMGLDAPVAEIAVVAALADRAHRSAIVAELARTLLNRLPASSAYENSGGRRARSSAVPGVSRWAAFRKTLGCQVPGWFST